MILEKKRLWSLGDFGDISNGGIYNPSFIEFRGKTYGIFRMEPNYDAYDKDDLFTSPVYALFCQYDKNFNLIESNILEYKDFEYYIRNEDFRLFVFQDELYVAHSGHRKSKNLYFPKAPKNCQQCLSIIDVNKNTLTHKTTFQSPLNQDQEKNWGWFQKDDRLFFVYSILPWILYEYKEGKLILVHDQDLKLEWKTKSLLSISSLPVEYEENFLCFVHSKTKNYVYIQTALIIDRTTLLPKYFVSTPLLKGGEEIGKNQGVLYVTSTIVKDEHLEVYYGSADSHSEVLFFDRKQFNNLIYSNPIND